MRRGRVLGVLAVAIVVVATPGEASAQPTLFARADGRATNGYGWSLTVFRSRHGGPDVQLALTRADSTAVYLDTRPEKASRRRIAVDFGELGRASLRFVEKRRARVKFPGCQASDRSGTFRGLIRFRGESGYATVRAQRARGSVSLSSGGCAVVPVLRERRADRGSLLIGCGPDPRSALFALEGGRRGRSLFLATSFERAGELAIYRELFVRGTARNFEVGEGRRSAVVRPPQPFLGRPRYADGFLDGRLRAQLPGARLVQFAPGPATLTSLSEEDFQYPPCAGFSGLPRIRAEGAEALTRSLGR